MAKKNEAKIRFVAETGEFNESIKKANSKMSELRAELRLNETQMKSTGRTVEALETQHGILTQQLDVSKDKTEALLQKVNKAIELYGEESNEVAKLKIQLTNARNEEEKIKQALTQCNSELEKQKNAAKATKGATEQLTDSIQEQQSELNDLKEKYSDVVLEFGKSSDEAKALKKEIKNLSGELKENKEKLQDVSDSADKLDRSLDGVKGGSKSAGDGFTVLKGAASNLVAEGIQFAIDKTGELIEYFGSLPEETAEFRQDFATLTTAFENVGMGVETATNTWKELYAVLGEDDRAVETANNISRMADTQKELEQWVTITTGVWGTYQDALPVEGLAEAAGETAKTGTVTGALADALNWSSEAAVMFAGYMGEDVVTAEDAFNEALSECSTEEERQRLITETLTALYGDAAESYRDTAGAQMEATEAAAEQQLVEAELADAIEPVTTKFTEFKTELLENSIPAVESICDAILGAIEWFEMLPETVSEMKENVKQDFEDLKQNTTVKWNDIKTSVATKTYEMVVDTAGKLDNIKTNFSAKLTDAKSVVSTKLGNIKDEFSGKMNATKEIVSNGINKIKGFFNFEWSLPKLKMPHFKISGKFSIDPPSTPKFSVEWRKAGAIFTKPTIFPTWQGYQGVGEAGAEAVLPIERLEGYVSNAVARTMEVFNINSLTSVIADLASRPVNVSVNDKVIATATAGASDSVNASRMNLRARGLAI